MQDGKRFIVPFLACLYLHTRKGNEFRMFTVFSHMLVYHPPARTPQPDLSLTDSAHNIISPMYSLHLFSSFSLNTEHP